MPVEKRDYDFYFRKFSEHSMYIRRDSKIKNIKNPGVYIPNKIHEFEEEKERIEAAKEVAEADLKSLEADREERKQDLLLRTGQVPDDEALPGFENKAKLEAKIKVHEMEIYNINKLIKDMEKKQEERKTQSIQVSLYCGKTAHDRGQLTVDGMKVQERTGKDGEIEHTITVPDIGKIPLKNYWAFINKLKEAGHFAPRELAAKRKQLAQRYAEAQGTTIEKMLKDGIE